MNKMNFRIALESKKLLTNALLELMEMYEYSLITVTQICQESKLSRRTFYRLFETKEDVLNEYLDSLTQEFMDMISEKDPRHYGEVALLYFEFWKEHAIFLKILKRNKMIGIIYHTVEKIAPVIFCRVKPEVDFDDETLAFSLAYSLGGLNGMLTQWVEDDMKLSTTQLKTILEGVFHVATI